MVQRSKFRNGVAHGLRRGTTLIAALGLLAVGACGKSASPDADTSAPVSGGTGPATTTAPSTEADASAGVDAPPAALEVAEEADADLGLRARLEALSQLEIAGYTRARGQLQNELVTLQYDTAPNAKGNVASIELTVSVCRDCAPTKLADLEAQKEQRLSQLGELHAKNPNLVFEIKDFELMAQRVGAQVYARSYVDDGTTRASVHMLEVTFVENGFSFRFQAYPRSGFPSSAEELASAFGKDELDLAVKAVFKGASDVVWPPATP